MKTGNESSLPFEIERYELHDSVDWPAALGRRDFVKLLGGGLVVLLLLEEASAQESGGGRRGGFGGRGPKEIGAWLHVGADGSVTAYTGKVEIGQNIRASLAQVVAEELRVTYDTVRMVMGDTDLTPFDPGTFGSQTTPVMAAQLRKVAAAAREALIDLAAETWKVDRATLRAAEGKVIDPASQKSAGYGQLSQGQKLLKTIDDAAPTAPATQWKIAGHSTPKADGRDFVTGRHKYPSDIRVPEMWFGKVLRPPAFGATLASLDTKAAEALPEVVVAHDGDFIGVAASTPQGAAQALAALRAEWTPSPQPGAKELFELLKRPVGGGRGGRGGPQASGSLEQGMAAADQKLRQTYTVAYIAHAPLEPRAAVAQWTGDKLTVWTGTQRPFGVRSELAEALGVAEANVRVIMPDMGSGYGGKHTGRAAVEAARLARACGKPVRLIWTREEEFTWAYFRPAGVIEVASGVTKDGKLTAWEFHNYNSGPSGIRTPYEVANQTTAFHPSSSPLQQGSYRGLAATANHFARETHMDELARSVGIEPLEFRLRNLKDPRLRAVLESATRAFGWGKPATAPGQGFGVSAGFEKGGYVATCAEVSADPAKAFLKVVRVTVAFECGAIVSPDHLRNQIEGAIVMGLGGALYEAIDFDAGKILNPRFSRYRVPRFGDAPVIQTVLVNRPDLPSAGAGETPIVGIAPAVGNAIFDACGIRLRSLPMIPGGLKAA